MLDIVQDASRERVALAGCGTVAVKVVVCSPAIGADLTHYVTALLENFPELRRSVGSRKPTCHAYDGDTVSASQLLHLPASSGRMLAGAHNPVRFSDRCRYRRRPLTKLTKGGPGPRRSDPCRAYPRPGRSSGPRTDRSRAS